MSKWRIEALKELRQIKEKFSKESTLYHNIRMHFLESPQTEEDRRIMNAATKRYSEAQKERIHAMKVWKQKMRTTEQTLEEETNQVDSVVLESYASAYIPASKKAKDLEEREKILKLFETPGMKEATRITIESTGQSFKEWLEERDIYDEEVFHPKSKKELKAKEKAQDAKEEVALGIGKPESTPQEEKETKEFLEEKSRTALERIFKNVLGKDVLKTTDEITIFDEESEKDEHNSGNSSSSDAG